MANYGIASWLLRPDIVRRTGSVRPENASNDIVQQAYDIAADFTSDPRTVRGQYLSGLNGVGAPIPQAATSVYVEAVPQRQLPIQVTSAPGRTVAVPGLGRVGAMGMNPGRYRRRGW